METNLARGTSTGTDGLVWSNRLDMLQRQLAGELTDPFLDRDSMISVRMGASRTKEALAGMLGKGDIHEDEVVGMAFSVSRDGGSSELRVSAASTHSATKLLD